MLIKQATKEIKEVIDKLDIKPKKFDETCEGYEHKGTCEPKEIKIDGVVIPNEEIKWHFMGRKAIGSGALTKMGYQGDLRTTSKPMRKAVINKLKPFKSSDTVEEFGRKWELPDYHVELFNENSCLIIRADAENRPSKYFKFCPKEEKI